MRYKGRAQIRKVLHRYRAFLGKTRIDLAHDAGYSVDYIRSVINGKDKMTKYVLESINSVLENWEQELQAYLKPNDKG